MQLRRNRSARTATLVADGFLFRTPPRSTGAVKFLAAFTFPKDRHDLVKRSRACGHLAQQGEHVFARSIAGVQIHQQHGDDRHIEMR
jgi:hypothetical protein